MQIMVAQNPMHGLEYLPFDDAEFTQVACRQEWGIDGTVPALVAYWQERPDEYEKRMSGGARAADSVKQNICRNAWRLFHLAQVLEVSPLEMPDLSPDDAQTLLGWLDAFPPDRHGPA